MKSSMGRWLVCCIVAGSVPSAASADDPFPELKKLREIEDAYIKLRAELYKEAGAKEDKASKAVNQAREEWLKALRGKDKAAQKKAKEALQAAEKDLQHLRSLRFELSKVRMLGAYLRPVLERSLDDKLGLRLGRVSDVLASQLGLEKNRAMIVENVQSGSAADKAGLKVHDIILQWDGKDMPADLLAFRKLAGDRKAGDAIDLKVLRQGKEQAITGLTVPESDPARLEKPKTPRKEEAPKKKTDV